MRQFMHVAQLKKKNKSLLVHPGNIYRNETLKHQSTTFLSATSICLSSQKKNKRREFLCVYTIYPQTPRRHLERETHIKWLSSLIQYTLSDSDCHGKWVMMRQLANGLMGNEGASAGNWWLDAKLHSIYRIHAMLYTCNMLLSKCDSISVVKHITHHLPFDI